MLARARRLRDAHRLRRLQRRLAGRRLMRAFAAAYTRATFVEVGANDGEQHDHLRPFILAHQWRGVMVEPVPFVFKRLRRNYAGLDRVALENVALADRDGTRPFYHLSEARPEERASLPEWYDGIGSFDREHVLEHARRIPGVADRLVSTEVACMSFESLCEKHRIRELDLLLVDAEGYDAEILRRVDLAALRPRLVVYEHYHLGVDGRAATRERLEASGYETMEEGFDTWCLRPADDGVSALWKRLSPAVAGVYVEDEPRS